MNYEELKREEARYASEPKEKKDGSILTKPLTGVSRFISGGIKKMYLSEGPNVPSMMPITSGYLQQVGLSHSEGVEVKALKIADVCRQGCHDVEEISMATGIDKNEVNRILGELKKAGYAFYVERKAQ